MEEAQKILLGEASCRDIVKSLFNLHESELQLYRKLARGGPMRAERLARAVGKDRSTVYRCLQRLVASGLCYRESAPLRRGGYYHVYAAVPPDRIKARLNQCADDWYRNMREAVESFDLV